MPQMAPLWWDFLFLFFSSTILLFLVSNYFIKTPSKVEKVNFFTRGSHFKWAW